ncbi:MAG TPA: MHYT domain-containing protein [Steroidobacteraceae bacterium]|nr:MHYT domain-containing protein [Steroidobacteraceae bacterium]
MTGVYDLQLLVLSVLLAVLGSFTALNLAQRVAVSRGFAARSWLGTGAAVVGAALWSAQYLWMLAFRLPVPVEHHPPTMLFSLLFSVLVWFFALWIASGPRVRGLRLAIAGLCMGIGIAAVHFTGLFAMQIIPAVFYDARRVGTALGIAVLASWLALWLAFVLRQSCTLPMLIARAGGGLFTGIAIASVFYFGLTAAQFAPDSYSLGATTDTFGADTGHLLQVIAAMSALALLVVLGLTIIDHAREHPVESDTELADRGLLERRFSALHEVPGDPPLIALMLVEPGLQEVPAFTDPHLREKVRQELGQRLAMLVRPGDTVGTHKDHFVLLLAGLRDTAQVPGIEARVRDVVSRPVSLADVDVGITPAIGTSFFPHEGGDLDTLLRLARAARTKA